MAQEEVLVYYLFPTVVSDMNDVLFGTRRRLQKVSESPQSVAGGTWPQSLSLCLHVVRSTTELVHTGPEKG